MPVAQEWIVAGDITTYYPIHIWSELDNFTVEEIPVTDWNWDHNNGLGWGINSVDVGDSATVFGARMIYRPTGPEVLSDRLHWLHPFYPSIDTPVAEWITKQNKNLHWAAIKDKGDSIILRVAEVLEANIHVLYIRCAGGYVYETAFTNRM
tara:strand:- start:2079 stop:2531 length:453 start_codon:yes stop_codon:yes gene_type:complete